MGKQNVIYPHNGILVNLEKKGNSKNLEEFTLNKTKQSQKDK
jgi:hypothetical protein